VIGGGDWGAEKLIPDIVRSFMASEPVRIRNPDALRPWQHALDCLSGYLMLAEHLWTDASYGEPWNFGPLDSDTRPVRWIVERMAALWGDGATWEIDSRPAPHEATLLKLDSSKARARLGWKPRLDLENAICWTIDWYRAYRDEKEMRAVTLQQLERYLALEG
jgi:CDP-glucose 4,6-dehydratase